jgi:hypothetical protein
MRASVLKESTSPIQPHNAPAHGYYRTPSTMKACFLRFSPIKVGLGNLAAALGVY